MGVLGASQGSSCPPQVLGSRGAVAPFTLEGAGPAAGTWGQTCTCSFWVCDRCSTFLLKYPESCQASASPRLRAGRAGNGLGWLLLFCELRTLVLGKEVTCPGTTVAGKGRHWGPVSSDWNWPWALSIWKDSSNPKGLNQKRVERSQRSSKQNWSSFLVPETTIGQSAFGGRGRQGGGSWFGLSDLPWRVVTVPWELKEVMLGWVRGSQRDSTPDKPRFRSDREVWLLSCFLGSWWVHILDLRRGWKGGPHHQ